MLYENKILMLFCGGTISMGNGEEGGLGPVDGDERYQDIFKKVPKINNIADVHVKFIVNEDSSNMGVETWEKITAVIQANYDDYDGFLITTGTDTLAYMSSALSFSMQKLSKPVIITGSQIPLEKIKTDAATNLINSIFANCIGNLSGVNVVFGDRIILGSRARKHSDIHLNAFDSANVPDVGDTNTIFAEFNKNPNIKKYGKDDIKPVFKNGFDNNVVCVHVSPGINDYCVQALINSGVKIIIFRTFGTGNLPEKLFPALSLAKEKKIPVLISTQCPIGTTVLEKYSLGKKALDYNAIETYDMSIEATITKAMWMLSANISYEKFKEEFQKNVAGEISDHMAKAILGENDYK